jgi:hypothetical protein
MDQSFGKREIMSEMIVIDLPKAVALVLELIAEKPKGYKYTDNPLAPEGTCRNILWRDDMNSPSQIKPGCIVGSAVIKAGITPLELFSRECTYVGINVLADKFEDRMTLTASARFYLSNAQNSQDIGASWAEAHSASLQYLLREGHRLTATDLEWLGAR